MKTTIIFCIFFLALNIVAYCGQASRIDLTDGSVIHGEIVSYADGIYVVNTPTFGEIRVDGAKVAKIESTNASSSIVPINPTEPPTNLTPPQIDAYKDKLMNDPKNAAVITGLAADPQFQEIAKDPQIQEAIKSGNIQDLIKNEKFIDMVNSPKFQEGVKKLTHDEQTK